MRRFQFSVFKINESGVSVKKYILNRILISIATLLAILLVLFILMQLMPGSPFNDEKLDDEQRAVLYEKYGLDDPVIVQFGRYVWNMIWV